MAMRQFRALSREPCTSDQRLLLAVMCNAFSNQTNEKLAYKSIAVGKACALLAKRLPWQRDGVESEDWLTLLELEGSQEGTMQNLEGRESAYGRSLILMCDTQGCLIKLCGTCFLLRALK